MYRAVIMIPFITLGGCIFDTSGVLLDSAQHSDGSQDATAESASIEFSVEDGARPEGIGLTDTLLLDFLPLSDILPSLDILPSPDTQPWPDSTVDITVDTPTGQWYQANQKNCPTFCSGMGMANFPSPEGTYCMSGEVRPQSGIDQGIVFTFGCWPDCTGFSSLYVATSSGWYCYGQTQTKDNDATDYTVGCFCL